MKNRHFIPRMGVGGILVLTLAITLAWSAAFATTASAALAGENAAPSIVPIWSAESPALNHSTAALAMGRYARAIHFAAAAAPATQHGKALAAHNLCLAYLSLDAARAQSHCRAALQAADAPVAWVRGSATIGKAAPITQDHDVAGLRALMHANIAQAYGRAAVNQIVVANTAHPTP